MFVCLITQMIFEQKAVVLQKWAGCWLERQRHRRAVRAAILLQRPLRGWRPKKQLKKRKSKAHSVEHLQKLNVGMEKEIMQLQHKITQQVAHYPLLEPACWSVLGSGSLWNLLQLLWRTHWVIGSCHIT